MSEPKSLKYRSSLIRRRKGVREELPRDGPPAGPLSQTKKWWRRSSSTISVAKGADDERTRRVTRTPTI
jgi:hypothetical protein